MMGTSQGGHLKSYSYVLNVEHLERKELAPIQGLRVQCALFKASLFYISFRLGCYLCS
jgi:hypothetical protein